MVTGRPEHLPVIRATVAEQEFLKTQIIHQKANISLRNVHKITLNVCKKRKQQTGCKNTHHHSQLTSFSYHVHNTNTYAQIQNTHARGHLTGRVSQWSLKRLQRQLWRLPAGRLSRQTMKTKIYEHNLSLNTVTCKQQVLSSLHQQYAHVNEVTLHREGLLLRWVTDHGYSAIQADSAWPSLRG